MRAAGSARTVVVRCPTCTAVVLRFATVADRIRLDLAEANMLKVVQPAGER